MRQRLGKSSLHWHLVLGFVFLRFSGGGLGEEPPKSCFTIEILEISCFLVVPVAPLDYKETATSHKKSHQPGGQLDM